MTESLSQLFYVLENNGLCSGHYCYLYPFLLPFLVILLILTFRRTLLSKAKKAGNFNSLTWLQMEHAAKEYYRKQGYKVAIKGGGSADGGIDLIASKRFKKTLVQVKHYKAKVGVKVVREMLGVLLDNSQFDSVHIVSSTDFTKPAKELAHRHKVKLIGKKELFS